MGRRSDHSREEQVEMALAAAREIVSTAGFDTLTARRIAARMGYSAGNLYNLFDGLDALVAALNARTMAALSDAVTNAMGDVEEPRERIARLCRAYIGFCSENPELWRAVVEYRSPADQESDPALTAMTDRLFGLVESELEPFLADPERRAKAARLLWAGVHGLATMDAAGTLEPITGHDAHVLAEELVGTYLAGVEAGG